MTARQLGDVAGTVSECWDTQFNTAYRIEAFLGFENEEGDVGQCAWAEPEWSADSE